MISTVPPLFEDERNQDANNYAQNMRNMQALLVSRLLEQTNKKKNKKGKGKKTKGKSTSKHTTVTPRARTNLRQQLLLQQQARPPTSYAQPYVPQQEEKLQQAKDQAVLARNQLVNYQAAIQQQQEEARKSKAALKEAKAKAKAEEKRAAEAERHNAELEKQQAAYEDARSRYQKATNEGKLSELEMTNASLLAKVKMLEFAIADRKANIAQNKVAHNNEVLQTEVDSLTAERDALDSLLKTDAYSKSVDTQTALVKEKKELELQLDLKKKEAEQLAKNHELKVQLKGMPSAFKIRTLNNRYDTQIAYALMEQGALNTSVALKEDLMHEVNAKRSIWKDSVTKRERSRAELTRLAQEEDTTIAPTTDDIAKVNTEIANLNVAIDNINYSIENSKSVKGRYTKLANTRDDLSDELTRESTKGIALAQSSAPMVNAITNIAKEIGETEANLENVKNEQEPYIRRRKQLASLNERLSSAGNNVTIEKTRLDELVKRKPTVVKKIRKTLGNIASAEATLDQTKILTKAQQDANNAADNLHIEESVQNTIGSKDWLTKSRRITQLKIDTKNFEELKQNQDMLNKAVKKHTEDTILSKFFQTCAENDYNLDLHAHEVDGDLLEKSGIYKPEDQAIVLNSLADLRKASGDYAMERTRVATEATNILNDMNWTTSYNEEVRKGNLLNIINPPEVTREQFHAGVARFREYTGIPNAFNDIYHDVN